MGDGGVWKVIGGADKGGILVRAGKDTTSELLPTRLGHGALVVEEGLDGERLRYRLLAGGGPEAGWVSVRTSGKELLAVVDKVWKVVGGVTTGGILVRTGVDTSSDPCQERLATGALVQQLALEGERLHFSLLAGRGPDSGWISTRIAEKDKDLVVKVGAGAARPPTAAAVASEPAPPASRLRVLAMCGSVSCLEMMKFQCAQLAAALGKADAEWTYAEGTVLHAWETAAMLSDMERKFAERRQRVTSWYEDIYHCDRERPTIQKQFDPEVRVESVDIPEKVRHLRQYLESEGPFDAIVAFSQACIMVHYLIGHLQKEGEAPPWKVSVFFEGMHIRDSQYFDLFDRKSQHPTVHVFGTKSDYYTYAREGWCTRRPVEEYYEDPLVLTHDEGHQFPFQQPRAKEVYDAVAAAVRGRCGRG